MILIKLPLFIIVNNKPDSNNIAGGAKDDFCKTAYQSYSRIIKTVHYNDHYLLYICDFFGCLGIWKEVHL